MIAGAHQSAGQHPVITPEQPAGTNTANEVARKLTGRDYVSWSAIATFRTCPLKYQFRYLDGLPEESVSAALVFGTGIHAAIEQHFQAQLSGDTRPDVEQLMFAYRSAWLPHEPDQIQFGSSETRASLDGLATKMLAVFLNSPAASVQGRVLGVEEEIRGKLVEGVPDLYGRVDLLTEDENRLTITDIKTSRGRWSPEQVEDSGEQLLLYSKLASEISPGKKIQTRFLVLTKTKEPVVEEHVREVETGKPGQNARGRRAGLAGDRGRVLLPRTVRCRVCQLWLPGGVSSVGGVRPGVFVRAGVSWPGKSGTGKPVPLFSRCQRSGRERRPLRFGTSGREHPLAPSEPRFAHLPVAASGGTGLAPDGLRARRKPRS